MSNVERELPWSWHRSPGWRGQFDRLRRWHERLHRAANPTDLEDYLYAFFQNCGHLRDWLPPEEFDPKSVAQLFDKSADLQLARDISNMTKHFELSRPAATGREPSLAREYVGRGRGCFGTDSSLVVLSRGEKHDALELAQRCLRAWKAFLESRTV